MSDEIDKQQKVAMPATVRFVMRVKLPPSSGYAACPSGDTEYAEDYDKAIADAKPSGFEVLQPRANEKWPKDSEGFTWIPLAVTDSKEGLHTALEEWHKAAKALHALQTKIRTII